MHLKSSIPKYSSLVLDIGDVLLLWSPPSMTSVPPRSLKAMLSSTTWFSYEKGHIDEEQCYRALVDEFKVAVDDIRATLLAARNSLHPNHKFLSFIHRLRQEFRGLRIFAMSNIGKGDYDAIREVLESWNIFDAIFVSCCTGERKPHLGFYRSVISSAQIFPSETIFVDDKLDNVLSARSVGFHGIVFDDCDQVIRKVGNLFGDPIVRGRAFLSRNAGELESITDGGVIVRENFAQLLILEATNDISLVNIETHPGGWNFFRGAETAEEYFPLDLDTTSLAYSIMNVDKQAILHVMNDMLKYMDADGIIQTYFDHNRPRIDPIVCTNVLTLFYSQNRGSELMKTFEWVYEVLLNRAYLDGTRYYSTSECFLYFVMRFLRVALPLNSNETKLSDLCGLLKKRVIERIGIPGDSLCLAMRILACKFLGVEDHIDRERLLELQCEDGGWEIGWIYKYGKSGIEIGNRGLTTALSMEALQ